MHGLGHEQAGHANVAPGVAQYVNLVAADRGQQGCVAILPVGEQLIQCSGLKYGAGQDMGAHLGAFLDHANRQCFVELAQAAGSGQASGTCADDHHIVFHGFPGHACTSSLYGGAILYASRPGNQ